MLWLPNQLTRWLPAFAFYAFSFEWFWLFCFGCFGMILADAWLSNDLEPGGAKRQLLGHLSLDPSLIQPRLHYHHYYYY